MLQYAVKGPGERAEAVEKPAPELTGREVLVRVERSGVCHSDVHCQDGYFDMGSAGRRALSSEWPAVFGHEIVGEVVATGPEASAELLGRSFIVFPWIGCGACAHCLEGRENYCPRGTIISGSLDGGFADHVYVPDEKYLVDYAGIEPSRAATLACSGVTAFSAVAKVLPAGPEDPIVVIGAGGLGLNAVAILAARGHGNIVAVDRRAESLEFARKAGAHRTLEFREDQPATQIAEALGEDRAHGVVDFVNSGETATAAFLSLRKGGTMVPVGLFGGEVTLPTVALPFGCQTISGSFVGSQPELEALVELVREGTLPEVPLNEQPMSEDTLNDALEALRAGTARGRTVLVA
jgi:propanol-preferring alcohol dehydrogenase